MSNPCAGCPNRGYAATTLAAIAREAGVSVETIYKAFGGKSGLVRALYERGLTGIGPVPRLPAFR
ncbi:MAG: TetR/AcrR family transcriptional regulator [Micromonosporaceae bacterium]